MHPFLIFRAPNKRKQHYVPRGKNRFRIVAWVKPPFTERDTDEILVDEPVWLKELLPVLTDTANDLMDKAINELYEHWATFLLSVNDNTTDDQIDEFFDNFPIPTYGYECYIWR